MKDMIRLALLVALYPVCLLTNAQENIGDTLFIHRNERGKIEFVKFEANGSSERKMTNDVVFLKSVINAKEGDEFRLKRETIDNELGITHRRFQQYFKGIRVDNAEYLVHGRDGNIEIINGDFQIIDIETIKPSITEQQALAKALEYVRARKYKWEDEPMEKFVRENRNEPDATYYPKGELVIAEDNLTENASFKLSWQFTISSFEPDNEQLIFVDATNGEIIRDIPLILSANSSGTAQTMYSNTQTIICDSYSGGFRLYETRPTTPNNNVIVRTLNCLNGTNYSSATEFSNTNTNWTSGSWNTFTQNQAALDIHWAVERTLDYWSTVHGRNSLNGAGLNVTSYVRYDSLWDNAQWDGSNSVMRFGDGSDFKPFAALDIVAHEMGHAITQFTSNLTYGYTESGALNEGFSDIWGACVKAWVNPTLPVQKDVWLCGREIIINPGIVNCVRDMQNPKTTLAYGGRLYASKYQGTNWNDPQNPIYCKSTVLSHWFYLLSQGGSGNNDGLLYNIYGIGMNRAERIAFKLSEFLVSSSDFWGARNGAIFAAEYLYGANSQDVISVTNAWYAVGVGSEYATITGNDFVYNSSNYVLNNATASSWTLTTQPNSNFNMTYSGNNATVTVSGSNPPYETAVINALNSKGVVIAQKTVKSCVISGPSYMCMNGTYTLTSQEPATWSIDNNYFSITPLNNGVSAYVSTSNYSGQTATITALANGKTYSYTISSCAAGVNGPNILCSPGTYTLTNNAQAVSWTAAGAPGVFTITSSNASTATVKSNSTFGETGAIVANLVGGGSVYKSIQACNSTTINGPATVCPSGVYQTGTGLSANWSVTSGFSVNPSTGSSTTVTSTSLNGVNGTLTAVIGGVTVTKPIQSCNTTIIGPTSACPSGFYQTSTGHSVNWSVTSGFSVNPSTGISTTVTPTSNNVLSGTLTAEKGGVTVTQYIQSCSPIIGPDNVCGTVIFTLANGFQATNWFVASAVGDFDVLSFDSYSATVKANVSNGQSGALFVYLNTGGAPISKSITASCGKGGGEEPEEEKCNLDAFISAFPNPTTGILNIEIDDAAYTQNLQTRSVYAAPTYDIRLYDIQGILLRQTSSKGGNVQFDLSNLPVGVYYLLINDWVCNPVTRQIVVER